MKTDDYLSAVEKKGSLQVTAKTIYHLLILSEMKIQPEINLETKFAIVQATVSNMCLLNIKMFLINIQKKIGDVIIQTVHIFSHFTAKN